MAMVEAIKDGHVIKVSKRSFETMFADKGYELIKEKKKKQNVEHEEMTENVDPIDTIPVSEMTREQLLEYADKHDIDLSGTKSFAEAKKRVQKAIRESKM